MKKFLFCILFFFFLNSIIVTGQILPVGLSFDEQVREMHKYGVSISQPKNFYDMYLSDVPWLYNREIARPYGGIAARLFISKDRQCLVALNGLAPRSYYNREDVSKRITFSIEQNALGHSLTEAQLDSVYHSSLISSAIFNPTVDFNADSVCVFRYPYGEEIKFIKDALLDAYHMLNYPYCLEICIIKYGYTDTSILLFLSEEGNRKVKRYCRMLKGSWRFD